MRDHLALVLELADHLPRARLRVVDRDDVIARRRVEQLRELHAAGVAEALVAGQSNGARPAGSLAAAEEKIDDLRKMFVQTKLKNAIRLKKLQNENYSLASSLAESDIGAATAASADSAP